MKLISALLARNEAGQDRYLRRILARCKSFSDTIVVLDDQSSDETPKVAAELGCIVKTREHSPAAWGNEASARQELWELAMTQVEGVDDWILICDADQEFVGDPRELIKSRECNVWCLVLFDCWSATEYREDDLWQAHHHARPWLFCPMRVPRDWRPEWSARGIHTGHCPSNFPIVANVAPPDKYYWKHYAYATAQARKAKHAQYASTFHLMSDHERRHAESIIQ